MSIDANDLLLSSGVKSATFKAIGDKVTGIIVRQPETQQQRDFTTGESKTWKDGKPALQIKVILATDERDPNDPEDTGERALYIKAGMQRAVAAAVRHAGAKGLQVGGKLMVKYSSDGPVAQRGLNPPKIYEAKYRAPEPESVPVDMGSAGTVVDDEAIPF